MAISFGVGQQFSDEYYGNDVFIDGQYVGRATCNRDNMWELDLTMPGGKEVHRKMKHAADEHEAKVYFGELYSSGQLLAPR